MAVGRRVTHLTPALFGENGIFGGAERYSYEMARHMACVTPTRLVCFGESDQTYVIEDKLEVRVLGRSWKVRGQPFNRWHWRVLQEVLSCDVLHCHQPRLLAAEVAALAGRLFGTRTFASDLGGGGWGFSTYCRTDPWFRGHLHISQYSCQLACHTSNPYASVVYGGVDTTRFQPDVSISREPLVVYVGRLMPHKGVDDLIQALPPGLRLELIGRPYHEAYHARLQELAVGKLVRFRTDCTDADIVQAYRRALCVVLPSVYSDCYGNVTKVPELLGQTPLEGMACGAPAIVTDVASLPEVVEDGVCGFVVPPNRPDAIREKLEWLRDHRGQAQEMGDAGRRWVLDRFTWPKVVERCLKAYSGEPL